MKFFQKKQNILPLPEGFTERDIRTESRICTGETTIGFYSREDKKLHYAELVRSAEDIQAFYRKYGKTAP